MYISFSQRFFQRIFLVFCAEVVAWLIELLVLLRTRP